MPSPAQPKRKALSKMPILDCHAIQTDLIWATQREVEPWFLDLDSPYVPDTTIFARLVKRGEVQLTAGGHRAIAAAGQWMICGATAGHQKIRPGSILLSIRFSAQWLTGKTLFDHHDTMVFSAKAERKLTLAAEAMQSLIHKVCRREGLFLLQEGSATAREYFEIRHAFDAWILAYIDTMMSLGQQPSLMASTDQRILQALRLIDTCSPKFAITESELAGLVGLGSRQLIRLFLRELGVSPKRYIERRRLQEAVSLLRYHQRSVKEVAFQLGFASSPHFSAWFRRQQGSTPTAFQKIRVH